MSLVLLLSILLLICSLFTQNTLTDMIGIALTHNARSYAAWWLHTSISDTVITIDIANLTLMHVTIKQFYVQILIRLRAANVRWRCAQHFVISSCG